MLNLLMYLWSLLDLNQRLSDYESGTLTYLS